MSRQVISGSMKKVPTVSVMMFGFPGNGRVQSGTRFCPRTISQVIPAFSTRFIKAVTRMAL
jgi:hypothetical protein